MQAKYQINLLLEAHLSKAGERLDIASSNDKPLQVLAEDSDNTMSGNSIRDVVASTENSFADSIMQLTNDPNHRFAHQPGHLLHRRVSQKCIIEIITKTTQQ